MLTMKRVQGTNIELAQLKNAMNKISLENKPGYDLEWIFTRTNSLSDIKILCTKYLKLHHPELVNDTAFDIVLKHYNVLKILLDQKISLNFLSEYVRKEHSEISISISSIVEKHYDNLNVFSDPRYKLPNLLICSMLNVNKISSQIIKNPSDKYGISCFHIACIANDSEMVQLYLDNGVSVDHAVSNDCPYFSGYTPLHFAVKCCSVQTVKLLLERNAKLCLKDIKGMSALHIALENYIEFAVVSQKRFSMESRHRTNDKHSLLLSHDCYAEDYLKFKSGKIIGFFFEVYFQRKMLVIDDLGFSCFHLACLLGYRSLSTYENAANINQQVKSNSPLWPGYSPLHFAALFNENVFMRILIEKGGDIGVKDTKGITPLDICIQRYKTEDIYMLLSSHSTWKAIMFSDGKTRLLDFLAAMKDEYDFEKFVKRLPKNFNICIPYHSPLWPGFTPLHLVILFSQYCEEYSSNYQHRSEMITCIIRRSPGSLYKQNLHVPTPLDFAFRQKNKDLICHLLRGYRLLEYYLDSTDDKQLSCLHVTCARDDYSLVQQLLSWGNNVNVVYKGDSFGSVNSGWTPLHFAIANYSHSSVEILREHGCNVSAKDTNDMTPIHLLLVFADNDKYNGQRCTIESLLSMSNFQDAVVDGIGLSHLHVACFYELEDAVKRLVENGADINKVINYKPNANCGSTVLSSLAEFNGNRPLHLALQKGNREVVQLLLQLGADVFVRSRDSKALLCDFLGNHDNIYYDAEKLFFSSLTQSEDLQKRVEGEIGLTMLHVACRTNNVALVEELLNNGANVNAQIHMNSPVWPGYAPLHTLNYYQRREPLLACVREILQLLLDKGADVTLSSATGKTAVHVAYEPCSSLSEYENYSYVRILLQAQRDFSVNPRSIDGLSHFHVACGLNDLFIVEKFLRHTQVDVNQRVDYFADVEAGCCRYTAGCTPLHLAVSNRTGNEVAVRLEIVDLLLRCGADVHAEDVAGNTPLNKAVQSNVQNCRDLLERLVRAGSDMDTKNIFGKTPLEHLILKRSSLFNVTYELAADDIKNVLICGGHLNEYNRATGKGHLALALSRLSYQDMRDLITAVRINYPNAMEPKYKGRTAIHNIVSGKVSNVSVDQYAALIDELSKFDCNVDEQDDKGQTALHLAVNYQNSIAVCALMLVGADMGIRDTSGSVALVYNPKKCHQCDPEGRDNSEDDNETICNHDVIYQAFISYTLKFKLGGSDHYVRLLDEYVGFNVFVKVNPRAFLDDGFFDQLNKVQNLRIGSSSARFGDLLSETGLVLKYSIMSPLNREAIDDVFSINQIESFRDKCFGMEGILRFQYRRAVKRWNLMEASKKVLVTLTGYRLPDLCSEFLLQLLSDSDLKNLVASMT